MLPRHELKIFFTLLFAFVFQGCNIFREVKEAFDLLKRFEVSEQPYPSEKKTGKFSLEVSEKKENGNLKIWKVSGNLKADFPFSVSIAFNTGYSEQITFFIPGIWMKGNSFSQDKVYSILKSRKWLFREDRMPVPMVFAFDEKTKKGVAILKIPAKYDFTRAEHIDSSDENIIVDTDVASLGFDYDKKQILIVFPFEEYPIFYRRKILTNFIQLNHKKAFYKGEKKIDFYVIEISGYDFSDAILYLWQLVYDIYKENFVFSSPLSPVIENKEKLINLLGNLKHFFQRYYYEGEKIAGFYSFIVLETGSVFVPFIEASFTGMALMNGANAILLGKKLGDDTLIEKGRKVLISWSKNGKINKFFIDCFDPSSQSRCDLPPVFLKDVFYTRREFESLLAFYLAYKYDESYSDLFKEEFLSGARAMVELQREDGSFARAYRFSGEVADISPAGTLFAVPVFLKAYEITQDERFFKSALRAGEFIYHLVENFSYFGSTIDANSEDKEASMWAFISCFMLFRELKDSRYFLCAKRALYSSLWWFYLWSVPFEPSQTFFKINLNTLGLSSVSVENIHIDVYLFFFPKMVLSFSDYLQEPEKKRLQEMVSMMINAVSSLIPSPKGGIKGIPYGVVPEVIQQTWWDYGYGGKGEFNITSATGWTVASSILALSQFAYDIDF
jgi:hypothetical protein